MKPSPSRRFAFAAVAALALAGSASAAPHGIYRVGSIGKMRPNSALDGKVLYYGGPVIPNAKVYAVFWGEGVDSEIQSRIGEFYANMLDSGYMDWLKEYNTNITAVDGRPGTNQAIGRGSFAGAVTIQPSNPSQSLLDGDIRKELEAQINAGKLAPADDNTLYMVYFPAGISIAIENMKSCQQFCAYHEGFKAGSGAPIYYGVMPVCGGFGCGASGFEGTTIVSSHEAIEAITDPFPTPGNSPAYPQAWNTSTGEEIGDLCNGTSATINGNGVTSTVQQQWDNAANACTPGPWTK